MRLREILPLLAHIVREDDLDLVDLPGFLAQFAQPGNDLDYPSGHQLCAEAWADLKLMGVQELPEDRGSHQTDRMLYQEMADRSFNFRTDNQSGTVGYHDLAHIVAQHLDQDDADVLVTWG